ncbi:MAG: hypothetical protein HYS13_19615 [Planctomycetia bacterium]|nr:hypothetical protein [Planctomycetia bacterium]
MGLLTILVACVGLSAQSAENHAGTPPEKLIDAICDDDLPLQVRREMLALLDDYHFLDPLQLRRLHKLVRGAPAALGSDLILQLGRLGNHVTLCVLLSHQRAFRQGDMRSSLDEAIFGLATKLNADVWNALLPSYQRQWEREGRTRPTGKMIWVEVE